MNANDIKQLARDLGADLVGIASAKTLNAFPPDPRYPQTPDNISPYVKSVIVIACHIPVAGFRANTISQCSIWICWSLGAWTGSPIKLPIISSVRDIQALLQLRRKLTGILKQRATEGSAPDTLGIEAGLGTFGLEVNILSPEFGPRLYLTGILTEIELEADTPMTEQVCIGESCARCLHSCPTDAVLHFGIDKRNCAVEAQEFGYMTATEFFRKYIGASNKEKKK